MARDKGLLSDLQIRHGIRAGTTLHRCQTRRAPLIETNSAFGQPEPPLFEAEPGLAQGDEVTITPTDYAHDPVAGQLVGLGREEAVVARTAERAGRVHVHFPRLAFQIKKTPLA